MITFFTSYLGGSHGTAKSARDFLRALLACHDSVRVISPNQEDFPDILCGKKLCTPEWIEMPRGIQNPLAAWHINFRGIKEWLNDRISLRRLRRKKTDDAVIVNGWASCGKWQLVEDCFAGPKGIVVRESTRHFSGPDRKELLPDLLRVFSSFDHLIFVSERVCHDWRKYGEIAVKPYAILPNCCEEEEAVRYAAIERSVLRQQLGLSNDDFVVLCPGTIEHRKGQDLLLGIVRELYSKIPNLRILLVGDPVTKWGEDLLRAVPRDLLGRTIFHQYSRPGIMDLLHASDILAFPSRAEAMPRTVLEAMVMKTPIVASNVDGIPELIVDGTTGLLFPRDDKDGLLSAILHVYCNPEIGKHMTESGSDRYWSRFSRSHQFDSMADVLRSISI